MYVLFDRLKEKTQFLKQKKISTNKYSTTDLLIYKYIL